MRKHRGLFLTLGLAALVGLMAPEARAGNITMTITVGSSSLTFDSTDTTYAVTGSSADSLTVNTTNLNNWLTNTAHSVYNFSDLGSSSNNPGQPNPIGGTLGETGTAIFTNSGTGFNNTITIHVVQTAFTIPTGPGSLGYSSTANFTNAGVGNTQVSSSSFNSTNTSNTTNTVLAYPPAANPQPYSNSNTLSGLTAVATGYSLDNTATITLTQGKDQFSVSAQFTTAIPEPGSLLMMLTGMPLPLVVMGLLRRRRAAA
jgi:hypothetical protein